MKITRRELVAASVLRLTGASLTGSGARLRAAVLLVGAAFLRVALDCFCMALCMLGLLASPSARTLAELGKSR